MAFPTHTGRTGQNVHLEEDEVVWYQRQEIYLVDSESLYKAKPAALFQLKTELLHKCMTLAYYRKFASARVPMLKEHWLRGTIVPKLYQVYYKMTHSADFDRIIYTELRNRATEEREGYFSVCFDEDIMALINRLNNKPRFLSAPLYYGKEGIISTRYNGRFFARFQSDYFRHETIVVRQAGTESFFALYNNHRTKHITPPNFYESMSFYNSEWVIPFLIKGNQDEFFESCGTTFRETYEILKGLINYWYDFTF